MTLTIPDFVARWRGSTLSERAGAQPHFLDLCEALGVERPAAGDQSGTTYTFEKGVNKTAGTPGYADVWKRGHFAWEYKGPGKNLADAYQQLLQYREALENPPLLVVSDRTQFQVHTNFTNTAKRVYTFTLDDLPANAPSDTCWDMRPLDVLRAVFDNAEALHPQQTTVKVTEVAAAQFARLADSLRARGVPAEAAAGFLMRLLFCLFAEDIRLLPEHLFTRLVEKNRNPPQQFTRVLARLFEAMAAGDLFGEHSIAHFNGGLFTPGAPALDLTADDLLVLRDAAALDWASVEPAIFGTLFERSLDPDKRSKLGAHYTGRDDILLIVDPVLMAPLQRRWAVVQEQARALIAKRDAARGAARTRQEDALVALLLGFANELGQVRVLDPACGSGNFLYVALKRLLDLWKQVLLFARDHNVPLIVPRTVGPQQLYGIEVNPYAHALASVVVWIGYIQWLHDNGIEDFSRPILRPLHNIQQMDAILAYDAAGRPVEPAWPAADVVIGNPPFLGGKLLRTQLGDKYVDDLFALHKDRVPREADLVAYWFEKARDLIGKGQVQRVGLLATQAIRGGANRKVLERIKQTGDMFMAWSDRPWILDGAAVRVSMIGFDNGNENVRVLDGEQVMMINSNLTSNLDLTRARRLAENLGIAFQGPVKVGRFDIDDATARSMLREHNPNGLPNSEVIRPWLNGADITRRPRGMWIIDFGELDIEAAALFEAPFEYVKKHIKPSRDINNDRQRRAFWWRLGRSGSELKSAKRSLTRIIVTPRVAKHRLFVWLDANTVPDCELVAIARDDDYMFGVLQSRVHELWALRMGTALEDRPRYTPTTTFETFPFPWPPGQEPAGDPRVQAIAAAARDLVAKRDAWLDPAGAPAADLKARTLTALYNARPTWLAQAHARLDAAVLAAYGWPADLTDAAILERLLALNQARAGAVPAPAAAAGRA